MAFGPKAISALLAALDDATPTKAVHDFEHVMGAMWYGHEFHINPVNARERQARESRPSLVEPLHDLGGAEDHLTRYTVTRGDVCFVILGEIVNRSYEACRYQPTSCMVINSPTADAQLAAAVREAWQSGDPACLLFDSLMADLHTRDDQGYASADLQCGAAKRLLYYFPD